MAAAVVPHTVKTVLAQTVQLDQHATAHSSHAKPATAAQIADATGPQTLVTEPASLVTPQTTAQPATHARPVTSSVAHSATATHDQLVMANAVRLATAHSAMESVDHSATAHSATANAVHSVTATAVPAQLLVMANAVNGLLAETAATSVRAMTAVTTVAHAMVLAPKIALVVAPLVSVQALQLAVNTVAATHRVTASAVTA